MAFYDLKKKPALTTKEGEKETLYAGIVYSGTITSEKLLERVAEYSGFKVGDMEGALTAIMDMMAYYIGEGYRVELGDIGYFSGKLKSRLVEKKTDIRSRSIRFNGVNFRASAAFKRKASGELERSPHRYFRSSSRLGKEELKRRLINHLEKYGFITRSTYTQLTGRLKKKALEDLHGFVAEGLIRRIGAGNQLHFVKAEETPPTPAGTPQE